MYPIICDEKYGVCGHSALSWLFLGKLGFHCLFFVILTNSNDLRLWMF